MSAFRNVSQRLKEIWGQGGDEEEEYEDVAEETEEEYRDTPASHRESTTNNRESATRRQSVASSDHVSGANPADDFGSEHASGRYQRFTTPSMPTASRSSLDSGSGSALGASMGSHKLRPVAMPLRSREKNIYTLKPKSMDEASLAADYLKTGCAVVLNLDEVEKMVAIRIIDFMSGVCYGLENQGHAMKLGDTIFLFTPGDFEISSDETDYGENRDFIFKDESHAGTKAAAASVAKDPMQQAQAMAEQRRSWER
jgi:FtsZ-interacting cell division protein YlmF